MSVCDDDWDRVPTALEAAHYNAALRRMESEETRLAELETQRKRVIFGECLHKLVSLGLPEAKGRSMLGKWRGQAKDDALLVRIINHAHSTSTPDPISYVTKALAAAAKRAAGAEDLAKSKWALLGWEKPRANANGKPWRGEVRGQVWRDPFGNIKVLPPPDDVVPPTVKEDPGYAVEMSR